MAGTQLAKKILIMSLRPPGGAFDRGGGLSESTLTKNVEILK